MTTCSTHIRERVGAYLARDGVTRKSIADRLGCTPETLKNKLDGITQFTLDEAFELADIIGCSADDFRKPLS